MSGPGEQGAWVIFLQKAVEAKHSCEGKVHSSTLGGFFFSHSDCKVYFLFEVKTCKHIL